MRALFVAATGDPGGAELALETYLAHLPAGIEAHALVLSPGPLIERFAVTTGRPAAVAAMTGRPSAARAIAFARGLHAHLRRLRPAVVLATGIKAAVLCAPACRLAGVPLAWQKVDFGDPRIERPLALACSGVIPVSAAVAAGLPARRRLEAVPPPVRLDPAFRVGDTRPPATIGSIGRLVPYKGHADVIAAAALLRARFPDVRVVIAGGADRSRPQHAAELRELARVAGIGDRVELLDHVDRVEDVYERLSIVVGATYRDEHGFGLEGFGAALAEAGWAGLPVVATRGGGTAEAVVDGVTGRLVPARDPAALAAAITGYLANPAAAADAGANGARRARETLAPAPLARRLAANLERVARV